jgi:exoribonuclease-2
MTKDEKTLALRLNSLVLYKNRPARVTQLGDKIELELGPKETIKVRPKDIVALHPGPLKSLADLALPQPPRAGDAQTVWEILAGNTTTLPELAELIYDACTPATVWAAWQVVLAGVYFGGEPERIQVYTRDQVAQRQAARAAEAAEKRAWAEFIERAKSKHCLADDARFLGEVTEVALGRAARSRVLRELGRDESPESAHALLLDLGYWEATFDPYPARFSLPTDSLELDCPAVPDEARLDLTHLPAFAIDDQDTETPDDAVSWDGARLWVHVADAAALVAPDSGLGTSALDLAARARAASLHLPEKIVHMLPPGVNRQLALGLNDVSPALSFALELDAAGQVLGLEVRPSLVRVARLTYTEAEAQIDQEPLSTLYRRAVAYQARRQAQGAISFDFPEVQLRVMGDELVIRPVLPLRSRTLVREAMVMVGEAVARFALEHHLPLPFATQEPGEVAERPKTLAEMYALRRLFRPRQYKSVPAAHAGLGLEAYAQATSPLRRYLDLVVHQQLRAHLRGGPVLDTSAILERIVEVEQPNDAVRRVERLADQHWIAVYLLRHPQWRGEGVVVERHGPTASVIISELALEARAHARGDAPLNSVVRLVNTGVNLPLLDTYWRMEK